MIRLIVDYENNNESFWEAFRNAFPNLNKDEFYVTEKDWEKIQSLPGWNDPNSPRYAPHPLLRIDEEIEE